MISLVDFDIAWCASRPPQPWRPRARLWRLKALIGGDKTQPDRADAPFEATHSAKAHDAN